VTGGKTAIGGIRAGVEPFIEQLAAPTATPGGGSASAAAGAMAAALGSMVAGMSRGKKAYQQHERELSDAIARLNRLREELKAGVEHDAASYAEVMRAYKDAKSVSSEVGERTISDALKNATRVPLGIAQNAHEVRNIVESLKPITGKNMWSDLAVASALARTAIEGGLANVQINLQELKDDAFKAEMEGAMANFASI